MSDSFADLWQSSAPTNKPQTLSSLNASNAQPQAQGQRSGQAARAKPDVFALLASNSNSSSSSGGAAYRPQVSAQSMSRTSTATTTGSTNSLSSYSYSSQPGSRPSSTRPGSSASAAQPAVRANGSDAFGDLFSGSTTSLGSSSSNMTLAARAKMEQEQKLKTRLGATSSSSTTTGTSGFDAWAGLDALGGGASAPSLTATRSTPESTKSPAVRVDDTDDWGLGDFGAPTVTTSTSRATQGGGAAPRSTSTSTSGTGTSKPSMGSTQDVMIDGISDDWGLHDFGRAGNGNAPSVVAGAADDDDILGMLSRPVEDVRAAKPAISLSPSPPPQRSSSSHSNNPPTRSTSTAQSTTRDPPPHILGQIVEMGFSIPQARNALLNTLSATGDWDVQAALETLLSQSNNGSRAQTPADTTTSRRGTPQQQAPPPQPPRPSERAPPKGRRERDLERQERQERLARLEREIAASASSSSSRPSQSQSDTSTVVPAELAQQAERVLEMGKEMGRGMLGKASAFWREGRERVEKALVEREEARSGGASGSGRGAGMMGRGAGGGSGGGGRPGAPKWMQDRGGEHDHDEEREGVRGHGALSGYADEEDEHHEHHDSHRAASPALTAKQSPRNDRPAGGDTSVDLFSVDDDGVEETTHATQQVEEEVDLFSMPVPSRPAPSRSVPPRQPPSSSSSPAAGSSSNASRARPPASRPTPASVSSRKRTLTTASPSAIAQASKHRAAGTASFKLGQYADAASAYSQALDALPAGHLLRIPLLTNRALALIRTGECKGAERDCAEAVRVVVALPASSGSDGFDPSSRPSAEEQAAVDAWTPAQEPQELVDAGRAKANDAGWEDTRSYEGVGVDLIDGYIKARRRRAEALEMQEKWRAAVKDWEALANAPWVGDKARGEARTGLGRCRRMVGEDGAGANGAGGAGRASSAPSTSRPGVLSTPARPKPRVPVKPASISATPSGAAVKALQATNAQAEAEDTMRHSLKDSVDARLTAWRGGKETNIRALLASLDTVLWPEILAGGVQVSGLGALITPAQVKKGYVKAIARVHPDKLNPTNSTVEQRMLANGVFGTLNEAWIAFQAGAK